MVPNSDKQPGEKLRGYMIEPGGSIDGSTKLQSKAVSLSKAISASTAGSMSVFEISIAGGRPPHIHQNQDECIFVISGRLGIRIGEDEFDAPPESFLFLPKQVMHRFWANEPNTRILIFTTPGGVELYERDRLAAGSVEEQQEVGRKYGMSFVLDDQELALPEAELRERCHQYGITYPEAINA